jgi:hypothetical protein
VWVNRGGKGQLLVGGRERPFASAPQATSLRSASECPGTGPKRPFGESSGKGKRKGVPPRQGEPEGGVPPRAAFRWRQKVVRGVLPHLALPTRLPEDPVVDEPLAVVVLQRFDPIADDTVLIDYVRRATPSRWRRRNVSTCSHRSQACSSVVRNGRRGS